MEPQDLQTKWDAGECTYPLCPIKNMTTLNCTGCPALTSDKERKMDAVEMIKSARNAELDKNIYFDEDDEK